MKRYHFAILLAISSMAIASLATAETRPYEARLAQGWKSAISKPAIQVWERNQGLGLLSVTVRSRDARSREPMADPRAKASANRRTLETLQPFISARKAEMARAGLSDWTVASASIHRTPNDRGRSQPAFQLLGTYSDKTDLKHCFAERQIGSGLSLLLVLATKPSKSSCDWNELASWLDQIVVR